MCTQIDNCKFKIKFYKEQLKDVDSSIEICNIHLKNNYSDMSLFNIGATQSLYFLYKLKNYKQDLERQLIDSEKELQILQSEIVK